MGTERILVHSSIATAFAQYLKGTMNDMQQSPVSAPILISRKATDRVQGLISDVLDKGCNFSDG